MTPMKTIALIFIAFALIKLAVILTNPQSWKSFVKKLYSRPIITMTLALVAAAAILIYLLEELTIVQIFACMTFMMALMMVQFAAYGKEIVEISDKFLNDKSVIKKAWLSISIWIILMIWVVYEILR